MNHLNMILKMMVLIGNYISNKQFFYNIINNFNANV